MSHKKEEYDHVPTPEWLLKAKEDYWDCYPLGGEYQEPPKQAYENSRSWFKVWMNPGYSRKEKAIETAIRLHREGHHVELLIPMESSTTYAKPLLQYGVERMYFDHRLFPGCRNVELFVLTGQPRKQHLKEAGD